MPSLVNVESELLREPNLLIPGKAPIGPVKINWSNPITANLHSAYHWNSFSPHDITGFVPKSLVSVVGSAVELKGSVGGQSLVWDGTASNHVAIADLGTIYQWQADANGSYSVLHVCIFTGAESSDEFGLSSNQTVVGNQDTLDTVYSLEDGKVHMLLATRSASGCALYADGTEINTAAVNLDRGAVHQFRYQSNINTIEMLWGSLGNLADLMVAGTPQKSTDRWNGPLIFSAFWNRQLSSEEGSSITTDPYQVLIPA